MFDQKWQISLFATQKQENDWVYTPNQGALRCAPPGPLSRLPGYPLAVRAGAAGRQKASSCFVYGAFTAPKCLTKPQSGTW